MTDIDTRFPDRVIDLLAEHRASGNCAPADWGFVLDDARVLRLQQMITSGKPLPAWAMRECQRLRIVVREVLKKAA